MGEQLILEELMRLCVAAVVFGIPVWKILSKAGFNQWWTLLLFAPPFGVGPLLLLLFLAFRKWPVFSGAKS